MPYYDEADTSNPTRVRSVHPYIARCMGLCNPKTARKSPTVLLDPYSNNKTIISGGGSKFKADTDCYWELFQNPQITAGNKYYKYQIELNFTQMAGVLVTVHNGTNLFFAGDAVEVDTSRGY